jgi:hypothetical protein
MYYITREAELNIKTWLKLKANIITNIRFNTDNIINLNNKNNFNPFKDNEDIINININ